MILVYHHNDLDGICSAAIIVRKYGTDNVKCIPVQYNENTWNCEDVKQAELVYVLDFTFPDMETLFVEAGNKLIWCDHHKTAMERHTNLWNASIEGCRGLKLSGCELTWITVYDEEWYSIPESVEFIGDRDLWKFEYPETKAFCAGCSLLIDTPYHQYWDELLQVEDRKYLEIIELGKMLLDAQNKRVDRLFEAGFPFEFHGYNALAVNSTSDISELGEYIYTHGIELAVIWHVKGDNVIVSLRSNTVDCSEIAKRYGGGGHVGAAGFTIPNAKYFPLELI